MIKGRWAERKKGSRNLEETNTINMTITSTNRLRLPYKASQSLTQSIFLCITNTVEHLFVCFFFVYPDSISQSNNIYAVFNLISNYIILIWRANSARANEKSSFYIKNWPKIMARRQWWKELERWKCKNFVQVVLKTLKWIIAAKPVIKSPGSTYLFDRKVAQCPA